MSEKRTCAFCGKKFDKRGRCITCSEECAKNYKRQYNMEYLTDRRRAKDIHELTEIECRVCKKKFKKKSGNQVYCSEECRNKGKLPV